MIINFKVEDESIDPEVGRQADKARRALMNLYPNAVWQRNEPFGHKIIID